jgi:DNA-binding CsgD family transcriptional regulator
MNPSSASTLAPCRMSGPTSTLSPREIDILELLIQGNIDKEIADKLGISRETVRTHLGNIFGKLKARTRTEAAVKYLGH